MGSGYVLLTDAAPSGQNWETVQEYSIKGVFSTTKYKGKANVKKYLAQPAQTRELSAKERNKRQDSMSADGKTITTYEQAKKFGSWWTVKAIFTFDDEGQITKVWAGKA